MKNLTSLLAGFLMLSAITASGCTVPGDLYGGQEWQGRVDSESPKINAWSCDNNLPFNCDD